MTDLLGVCLAWGDGRCVIAPESGEPVSIAIADIVSGKPVPPRPSPRLRVSPRAAEEHTRWLWPHLEVEALGEWQLRSDPAPVGRLLKRANSCLAFGSPGLPLPAALARVEEFYAARGRDVVVQLPLAGELESALVDRGWTPVPGGDAHFLLASLSWALRAARRHRRAADLGEPVLEEDGDAAVVRLDGAASGRAAYRDDWLGLHGLAVDPAHRRRGLATAVVGELLEWGAERGATTAWLHVEVDNSPAIALYEALGFTRHHTCRYLVPPAGGGSPS
nr:GNAT family N-acetyltransferase [Nocardioides panaciterrulae]